MARLLCLLAILFAAPVKAQQVAITIDDLPWLAPSRTSPEDGLSIVRNILRALHAHEAQATGFVVGRQINEDSRPALIAFAEAGHGIGNHTWSHGDYGEQSRRTFIREVRRTDKALGRLVTEPRFFRFPYLREGLTEAAKSAADAALADLGYRNAPVTIDNDEWRYNAAYRDALAAGQADKAARIGREYLAHMQERSLHFQARAQALLGRDVKHILLIHMNRINAAYLDDLLDWYAAQGWRFVSLAEAMTDPVYSMPDLYAGPRGLSQLERIAPEEQN